MTWLAGCARTDITVLSPGGESMGWGLHHCRLRGIEGPLFARAFALTPASGGAGVTLVCADLWGITQSLRDGVLDRLAVEHGDLPVDQHNLHLCASHTHSGPGGYQHDLLYTLNNHGICPEVSRTLIDGIVAAIVAAHARRVPARAWLHRGEIPLSEPVAFNRSLDAYNRNENVRALPEEERHRAVNREMTLLRLDARTGEALGCIAWFATHATSLHNDFLRIHGDNKGIACGLMESFGADQLGQPDFVAAFPQLAAGDVTPNFRYHRERGFWVGSDDDDLVSAAHNGRIQFERAQKLFDTAQSEGEALEGPLEACLHYVDFSDVEVPPDLARGLTGRRTGASRYGLGLTAGTAEGPGPLRRHLWVVGALSAAVRWHKRVFRDGDLDSHGPMFPFLDTGFGGDGRAFGLVPMRNIPTWWDPSLMDVRRLRDSGTLGTTPWVANIAPVQLVQLGSLALAATPNEPTTEAGNRIAATVRSALSSRGVRHVLPAGYANAYTGYLTTFEEYQLQRYEGSTTVYGQWSLGAFRASLRTLARALDLPASERRTGTPPPRLTPEELAARRYYQPEHPHVTDAIEATRSLTGR